jgi:hypothetical protein
MYSTRTGWPIRQHFARDRAPARPRQDDINQGQMNGTVLPVRGSDSIGRSSPRQQMFAGHALELRARESVTARPSLTL